MPNDKRLPSVRQHEIISLVKKTICYFFCLCVRSVNTTMLSIFMNEVRRLTFNRLTILYKITSNKFCSSMFCYFINASLRCINYSWKIIIFLLNLGLVIFTSLSNILEQVLLDKVAHANLVKTSNILRTLVTYTISSTCIYSTGQGPHFKILSFIQRRNINRILFSQIWPFSNIMDRLAVEENN